MDAGSESRAGQGAGEVMKDKCSTIAIWFWLATACTLHGQGTFQNLNFELANIPVSQPAGSFVTVTNALPGWSAYLGTNQVGSVMYNDETIGSAGISLLSTNAVYLDVALQGRYSVLLQAGLINGSVRTEASISQTALVPASSQSIRFIAFQLYGPGRPFAVTLGGQVLALVPLSVTTQYTLYGADILAFAGLTTELRFTAFTPDGGLGNLNLDSIVFSNQPIPEPSAFGLFGLGALLLGGRFQRKRRVAA